MGNPIFEVGGVFNFLNLDAMYHSEYFILIYFDTNYYLSKH